MIPVGKPPPSSRATRSSVLLICAALVSLPATAPAQRQFDELGKRALPSDSDPTRAVALGDVDGDGDLDVVTGNSGSFGESRQTRLYLGNGRGIFIDATASFMPADSHPTYSVALGDVDGDGDLDIAIGTLELQNRLYLNDGNGHFADVTAARMPVDNDYTYEVAMGDVDGDGDLDMVCANRSFAVTQNRLYLNDGSGFFTDATSQLPPLPLADIRTVALGDVDGDSDLDLIFGGPGPNRLYVNDGGGIYTDATAQCLPAIDDWTLTVALGDVDGDGDLDLFFGNAGQRSRLYLNNGAGCYTDATIQRLPAIPGFTTASAFGDLDGDGDLDLVVGNQPHNLLYLNDGTGTFANVASAIPEVNSTTEALALGDVDGDGDLDLISGNRFGQQNRLYLNDGKGLYADATAQPLPQNVSVTRALALGDVDGDGDLDLMSGNKGRQNRLYLNDGRGQYTEVTATRMPLDISRTWAIALGDLDGDEDLDAVIGNGSNFGEVNFLYRNQGAGRFVSISGNLPSDRDFTRALTLGDVDGDGDLDLAVGNHGQNRLYLNDGRAAFSDVTSVRLPADLDHTLALAFADIDLDDDLDLILGNDGQNRLYLNGGTGTYTDTTALRLPVDSDRTSAVAVGDVDGDGHPDIVLGNNGQNRVYINTGGGTYVDATAKLMPADNDNTRALELADFDGDGDLDLATGTSRLFVQNRQNRLYLNDGTGHFTDVTAARMPVDTGDTLALDSGDVDGDGDHDIVSGNFGQNRLFVNLRRQLDAPLPLHVGRTYVLQAYARHGPSTLVDVVLPFYSTVPVSIPIPPFGILGLDPAQMVALPPFLISQPSGVGGIAFEIPNTLNLVGTTFYVQALLIPYPLHERLSNVTADVLIR